MSNLEISRAQRLDQKVVELLPELSRAFAAKLIERGKVKINDQVVTKAGSKLKTNDKVKIEYDISELQAIPDIELPILYEDDDCVVINKPVGILTHSKGAFNPEATVATWLRKRLAARSREKEVRSKKGSTTILTPDSLLHSSPNRAGIVHRLDRATSGVMICAKTPDALTRLQKQFSQRKAKKTYIAIVEGRLPEEHAIIDMPIERNPKKPQTFRVGVNGKPAVTEYKVIKSIGNVSEIELSPQTGRTHQLRVHLSNIGYPIVGDTLYGGDNAPRLFLHARSLEITLPNRERRVFKSETPEEFKEYLELADAT